MKKELRLAKHLRILMSVYFSNPSCRMEGETLEEFIARDLLESTDEYVKWLLDEEANKK